MTPGRSMPFFAQLALMALASTSFYVWATRSFGATPAQRRRIAMALATLAVLQLVTFRITIATHAPAARAVHLVLMTCGVTLAVTALPLAIWMGLRSAGAALARAIARHAPAAPLPASQVAETNATNQMAATTVARRQLLDAGAGIALFGATGSMLGWGMARGRHDYRIVEVETVVPGLPRALDGYVVAQISDIHVGEFVGDRELGAALALIRRARPDLLVATGDLVDLEASYTPLVARMLMAAAPRDGVFSCLGNHDYYAGADRVADLLRRAGVTVLVDEGCVVRGGDGGGFALLGVDDVSSVRRGRAGPRLDRAIASVPTDRPRVLLSHQPPTVDRWAGQVALQLSGHTHGGQINPGKLLRPAFEYMAGRYQVAGTTLYVNRGFGTVGPPTRVGSPPEITRHVLVAG